VFAVRVEYRQGSQNLAKVHEDQKPCVNCEHKRS